MPAKQTRFAGPLNVGKVSKEELEGLRTLVSIEECKVIHVIFWVTGGGCLTLCAKASEKLSLALWTRLLGVSMIQQTDIIPPSVTSGEVSHKDVYALGVLDCRRVKGYEEFTPHKTVEDDGENLSVGGGEDATESEPVVSPPKSKKIPKKVKRSQMADTNQAQDDEKQVVGKRSREDTNVPIRSHSNDGQPSLSDPQPAKKQKLPYWVYPHLDPDPVWEAKVKSHLAIRMHNTRTANDSAKTPLDQLPVERVWDELYAESLVWCKEQMPKVVQPGVYHKEYVAQGMSLNPLATDEWREYAQRIVPTLWTV